MADHSVSHLTVVIVMKFIKKVWLSALVFVFTTVFWFSGLAVALDITPVINGTEPSVGYQTPTCPPFLTDIINGRNNCTGVLVRKRWVVTASSCLFSEESLSRTRNAVSLTAIKVSIWGGDATVDGGIKAPFRSVKEVYVHDYSSQPVFMNMNTGEVRSFNIGHDKSFLAWLLLDEVIEEVEPVLLPHELQLSDESSGSGSEYGSGFLEKAPSVLIRFQNASDSTPLAVLVTNGESEFGGVNGGPSPFLFFSYVDYESRDQGAPVVTETPSGQQVLVAILAGNLYGESGKRYNYAIRLDQFEDETIRTAGISNEMPWRWVEFKNGSGVVGVWTPANSIDDNFGLFCTGFFRGKWHDLINYDFQLCRDYQTKAPGRFREGQCQYDIIGDFYNKDHPRQPGEEIFTRFSAVQFEVVQGELFSETDWLYYSEIVEPYALCEPGNTTLHFQDSPPRFFTSIAEPESLKSESIRALPQTSYDHKYRYSFCQTARPLFRELDGKHRIVEYRDTGWFSPEYLPRMGCYIIAGFTVPGCHALEHDKFRILVFEDSLRSFRLNQTQPSLPDCMAFSTATVTGEFSVPFTQLATSIQPITSSGSIEPSPTVVQTSFDDRSSVFPTTSVIPESTHKSSGGQEGYYSLSGAFIGFLVLAIYAAL